MGMLRNRIMPGVRKYRNRRVWVTTPPVSITSNRRPLCCTWLWIRCAATMTRQVRAYRKDRQVETRAQRRIAHGAVPVGIGRRLSGTPPVRGAALALASATLARSAGCGRSFLHLRRHHGRVDHIRHAIFHRHDAVPVDHAVISHYIRAAPAGQRERVNTRGPADAGIGEPDSDVWIAHLGQSLATLLLRPPPILRASAED